MERKTILDLYNRYADEIYSKALKDNKSLDEISSLEDKLAVSLSQEQKELLEIINKNKNKNEKEEIIYQEMFISAFSLATKLFLEGSQGI